MAKAKKNLNTLLEPLAGNKSEAVIQELIQDNPLFQKTSIEKNSALINKRVPPSPRRIALSALHRIPGSGNSYIFHKKNESDASGSIKINNS